MTKPRRTRLEEAGWKVGDASELLQLSEVEEARVEARFAQRAPGEPRARMAQVPALARASRRRPGAPRSRAAPR